VLALVLVAPAWAKLDLAFGPGGGLALPLGGDITHSPLSWNAGLDARVTGFQPVVGLGLSASYSGFPGAYHDSLRQDSSAYYFRHVPVTAFLFTDLSRIAPRTGLLPYFRIGVGPCYWDLRRDNSLVTLLDSSLSRHLDYAFIASLGVEKRLPNLPLAVYLDLTGNYIASSHFDQYGVYDKDESYAQVSAGIRYFLAGSRRE
jgi:hypothetical protein